MSLLRCLLLVALSLPFVVAEDLVLLQSEDSIGRGNMVRQVITDLERGDVRALAHLDLELLLAPLTLDAAGSLEQHWTSRLGEQLAQLPAAHRRHAEQQLDSLFGLAQREGRGRHQLLALRLGGMSPALRQFIDSQAQRLFDHGHFAPFLALATRLRTAGSKQQLAIARQALALQAPEDLPLRLPLIDLGPAQVVDSNDEYLTAASPGFGLSVQAGLLICRDLADQVVWQLPLQDRQYHFGGEHVLLSDGTLWDRHGSRRAVSLPPYWQGIALPDARGCLVAHDKEVYRWQWEGAATKAMVLPEAPVAAPLLLSEDAQLWLTEHWLLVVQLQADRAEIVHQYRHDLDVGTGWRLLRDLDEMALLSTDGRLYHISSLQAGLRDADPEAALQLQIRKRDFKQLFAAALNAKGSDQQRANWLCHALAIRAIPASRSHMLELASYAGPVGLRALHRYHLHDPQDSAVQTALLAAARQHPDVVLPHPDQDPWLRPLDWQAVQCARNLLRAGVALRPGLEAATQGQAAPAPAVVEAFTHAKLGWVRRIGERLFRLRGAATSTTLEAFTADAHLLWRHSWAAPASLPGRGMMWRDGALFVGEGQHRVHLIDPSSGKKLQSFRVPPRLGMLPALAYGAKQRLAALTPYGVQVSLALISPGQPYAQVHEQALPGPASWVIPWGQGFLVRLETGQGLLYPGGKTLAAHPVLQSVQRPQWTAAGLWADGVLYAGNAAHATDSGGN